MLQVLLGRVASWQELQYVTRGARVNSDGASEQSESAVVRSC